MSYRISVTVYNNPDFTSSEFRDTEAEAEELAEKLRTLSHVTAVKVEKAE